TEAIDALVEPEAERVVHRPLDPRVSPVQVGLLAQERMEVVLPGGLVEGPRRTAEYATPVVRQRAVRPGIPPDVPVALRVVARGSRLQEPRVLVGRVVWHPVQQHTDVPA